MQPVLVLSATAVAFCLAHVVSASATTDAKWAVFKYKYGKNYPSQIEEAVRRFNWEQNLQKIERHNELFAAGEITFYLAENQYSDMSPEEFRKTMLGHVVRVKPGSVESSDSEASRHLPKAVNWREKGYVTEVKDQGHCGSCWAFSATGSLEGQHFKATGNLVSLSESNLIDCSSNKHYGNLGCRGGMMDAAFEYIIDNVGIDTEKSYPYDPMQGHCYYRQEGLGATMKSYTDVAHRNESALQEAVATVGPVSVAINADLPEFQFYGGGVFNEPRCLSGKLDHAVLVVGYGHDKASGLDYWIVKNSWSARWGNKGYIWMARNQDNQCGIASMAIYPNV